jgi:hypothetical protein
VKAHAVVAVPASMAAYARGLYGFLRELDQGCDLIIASLPVEEGLGRQPASQAMVRPMVQRCRPSRCELSTPGFVHFKRFWLKFCDQ